MGKLLTCCYHGEADWSTWLADDRADVSTLRQEVDRPTARLDELDVARPGVQD